MDNSMFIVLKELKGKVNMNWSVIDDYMKRHDFLPCDCSKIHNFVNEQNRTRTNGHRFVGGYLTRTELRLTTAYGYAETYSRIFLGIQEN